MLTIRNLRSYYGRMQALKGVSLHVEEGEIVALIGANGAGKTTLLNSIVGLVRSLTGQILFLNADITHQSPQEIIRMGVSLVPEGRQLFAPLTVMENLTLGAYQRYRREKKSKIKSDLDTILERFPILKERGSQVAGTLSGGEQQMLAVGRALMSRPKLLLLDEPSMGLAPLVAAQIFQIISELHQQGTTILLVEQNTGAAFKVSNRTYVIETGRVVLQGTPEELVHNREIKRAYLGREYKKVWE
ncbi:ABC transporter ATP-binding protein [Candidatus Aerophobetes bacterium]|uniref:ABC transporter ATP-binding protein n=1 Tax=Aerophobetes bacterium TaxID=2030807 RepID=A0A523ULC6_UNCAE|nr:MAG: ABC transporter ATP-binding protein [Candidatus Aerophobetes bacterium]